MIFTKITRDIRIVLKNKQSNYNSNFQQKKKNYNSKLATQSHVKILTPCLNNNNSNKRNSRYPEANIKDITRLFQ